MNEGASCRGLSQPTGEDYYSFPFLSNFLAFVPFLRKQKSKKLGRGSAFRLATKKNSLAVFALLVKFVVLRRPIAFFFAPAQS